MVLPKLFCQIACNCAHNQHAIHINLALVGLSQIKWRTIRLTEIIFLKLVLFHLVVTPSFLSQSVPEIVHFYNQKKFRIYKNLSTIKGSICRSK